MKSTSIKSIVSAILLSAIGFFSQAQNLTVQTNNPVNPQTAPNRGCGTGLLPQQFENWVSTLTPPSGKLGAGQIQSVFNIPVIVHVIHNNEAVNNNTATTGNNLSAAQIQSQINILNADFNGLNPDTSLIPNVFKPMLGKFQFNFCLAVVNPTGGVLAEPGIDRINRVAKGWTAPPYSTSYIDATIKPNSIWNPNLYMNMWVCGITGGILGYATFPNPGTSGLAGLSPPYGTSTTDGLVMLNTAFGNIGTVPTTGAYNTGRTATHEIGHWLGLRHIWGDGTCATDYCTDTPPAQTSNFGCPTHPYKLGVCTGNTTGEMTMNYMDYTNDACMYMFSKDQKVRAQLIMTNSPMRATLLTSTVCSLPTTTNEIGILYVSSPTYSQSFNCTSAITPTIAVYNFGSNTITSATYSYNVDGVNTQTLIWTGSLAPNSSLTVSMPQVINLSNGVHSYNVGVYAPNGGSDPNMINNVNNQIFSISGAFTVTAISSGSICAGSSATLTAIGGGTGYVWTPGNLPGANAVVSPTISTIYTLSAYSGTCLNTRTVSVQVGTGISISVNSTMVCAGTPATLIATGATSYTWSSGATTSSIVVTPTTTTIYTVNGSSGSCFGNAIGSVSTVAIPNVSVSTSSGNTVCAGQALVMNASGACTYTLVPGGLSGSSFTISPTSNTNYTVIGSCSGCIGSRTIGITAQPLPTLAISASTNSLCIGSTATLSALGATNYTWSTSSLQNSIVVSPTVNTTYSVIGMNNGCSSSTLMNLSVINSSLSANNQTICTGGTATLNASGAGTFSWSNGATGSTILVSPTSNTVYTVVNTLSGCLFTRTVSVTLGPALSLSINNMSLCAGGAGTLFATGANSYTWSTGATTPSIVVNPSLTSTYSVSGNNGACSGNTVVTVTVQPIPVITASVSPSNSICSGMSIIMYPTGACTYTFSGGSPTVNPTSNTNYTIMGMSCSGCLGSCIVSVTVQQPTPLTLTATSSSLCSGSSATITASGAGTYTWNNGSNGSSIVVSPSTTTTYSVSGSFGSCYPTGNITIGTLASPSIAVSNQTICPGGNAVLTASGANSYTWSNGSNQSAINVSPASSTVYSVTGSNGSCSQTRTVSVTVGGNGLNLVPLANPASICAGNTATLSATGANTYSWSNGVSTASTLVTPSVTTSYTVSGNSNGCSGNAVITVSVVPSPSLSVSVFPSDTVCIGKTVTLTATGSYSSFTWNNGLGNGSSVVTTPGNSTVYQVTGNNGTSGCSRSSTIAIVIAQNPQSVLSLTNVGCGSTCNGRANATSIGGQAPYSYSLSGTGCSALPCPSLCVGLYTLYTTDNRGCSSFNIFSISNTPNNLLSAFTTTNASCGSCADGALQASINGGVAPYTYSWSPGTGTASTHSNLLPGCYTVTATDAEGCRISAASCVGIATGVNNLNIQLNDIQVFPNPAKDQINIRYTGAAFNYQVYNSLGQLVASGYQKLESAELNTSEMARGVYLIEIEIANQKIRKKLLLD